MITLSSFFILMGFIACYLTSHKAILPKSSLIRVSEKNVTAVKVSGLILMLAGAVISMIHCGFVTGICTFFIVIMTLGSLVILFVPLRLFSYKTLAVVFLMSAIVELFVIS